MGMLDGLFGGGQGGLLGDPSQLALIMGLLQNRKGQSVAPLLMQQAQFQANQKHQGLQDQAMQLQLDTAKRAADEEQRIAALGPQYMKGNAGPEGPQVPGMDWQGYGQAVTGINPMKGLGLQSQIAQLNAKDRQKLGEGEVLAERQADGSYKNVASGNQKGPKVGDLQTVMSGQNEYQYRWDGKDWKVVGSGPRFKPENPDRPPQIYDGPQGPVWVQPPARGSLTGTQAVTGPDNQPIAAKKRDQPLTEAQGNATAYAMRAMDSHKLINDLQAKGFDPAAFPGVRNRMAGGPLNVLSTSEAQQFNAAKQNFVTAVLRKESGAAISQSEFDKEDQKYFPQPGDAPQVIVQKTKARELAIKALEVQAGQGVKQIPQPGGWSITKVD